MTTTTAPARYTPLPAIPPRDAHFPQPITALAFDPLADTLWTGTGGGSVAALHTPRGLHGVRFRACGAGEARAVRALAADEGAVRAGTAGGDGVGAWAKGGANRWFHSTGPAAPLCAFAAYPHGGLVAAATGAAELLLLSAATGTVTRRAALSTVPSHLHFASGALLAGGADGLLRVLDPRTGMRRDGGGAEHTVRAHAADIQGLAAGGALAYTIGWGVRAGRAVPDPLVRVFDVRTMRALAPLQFAAGPAFLCAVPRRASVLAVASNTGSVALLDAARPAEVGEFYQLDAPAFITSAAVSPTGAYMAFGDADGAVQLLTCADGEVSLCGFDGQPVEWADAPEPLPEITWDAPLSSVGMPHYTETLLSAWPARPDLRPSRAPPPIPDAILRSAKMNDGIMYAPLPRHMRGARNVVPDRGDDDKGRFRSAAARARGGSTGAKDKENAEQRPGSALSAAGVPAHYRRVEIEYSRFGVEDFDFGFYNKTAHSGLETHVPNCYTNALLQALHHTAPVRALATAHLSAACARERCLLCELGFLSRMLDDAGGRNCQASNFGRTAAALAANANALDLVDFAAPGSDYGAMVQAFHRFLLDRAALEGAAPRNPVVVAAPEHAAAPPPPLTQLLGLGGHTLSTCAHCGARSTRPAAAHVLDLIYPRAGSAPHPTLASTIEAALARELTHRAACMACRAPAAPHTSRRVLPAAALPPVLAVNANAAGDDAADAWADRPRAKTRAPFIPPDGRVRISDGEGGAAEYALRALVAQVLPGPGRPAHLVALVRVGDGDSWHLFNDFLVQPVPAAEALSFPPAGPGRWKIPAVLYLERVDGGAAPDLGALAAGRGADDVMSVLGRDTNIALNRDPALIRHVPLAPDERPTPGTLVAIDAEFVQMQAEEAEFRSDGTRTVLRPARLGLARVSVLRADGRALADDHVQTSEAVVDYLTAYSGVAPGDLDPARSRHTLTPLKVVYKKLRALVDCGCIFVGHGLSKDFRIINIFVPPEQVIDTVDVYFIRARQRRLSLRFLAWTVLGERIQAHTHDSIEDARTALRLWQAFQEHEAQGPGAFDACLEDVYKRGRELGWKPPPDPDDPEPAVPTAAASPAPPAVFGVGALLPAFGGAAHVAGPMFGMSPSVSTVSMGVPAFFQTPPQQAGRGRGRWGA